jgi:hypothetical protein
VLGVGTYSFASSGVMYPHRISRRSFLYFASSFMFSCPAIHKFDGERRAVGFDDGNEGWSGGEGVCVLVEGVG